MSRNVGIKSVAESLSARQCRSAARYYKILSKTVFTEQCHAVNNTPAALAKATMRTGAPAASVI